MPSPLHPSWELTGSVIFFPAFLSFVPRGVAFVSSDISTDWLIGFALYNPCMRVTDNSIQIPLLDIKMNRKPKWRHYYLKSIIRWYCLWWDKQPKSISKDNVMVNIFSIKLQTIRKRSFKPAVCNIARYKRLQRKTQLVCSSQGKTWAILLKHCENLNSSRRNFRRWWWDYQYPCRVGPPLLLMEHINYTLEKL